MRSHCMQQQGQILPPNRSEHLVSRQFASFPPIFAALPFPAGGARSVSLFDKRSIMKNVMAAALAGVALAVLASCGPKTETKTEPAKPVASAEWTKLVNDFI